MRGIKSHFFTGGPIMLVDWISRMILLEISDAAC
jgi:hypothetical protein